MGCLVPSGPPPTYCVFPSRRLCNKIPLASAMRDVLQQYIQIEIANFPHVPHTLTLNLFFASTVELAYPSRYKTTRIRPFPPPRAPLNKRLSVEELRVSSFGAEILPSEIYSHAENERERERRAEPFTGSLFFFGVAMVFLLMPLTSLPPASCGPAFERISVAMSQDATVFDKDRVDFAKWRTLKRKRQC